MKALQIVSYEGPSGLVYGETAAPEPGSCEVALDVSFAGANYVEALFADGLVPLPVPWVPGIEASGRVRQLGGGVEGMQVGEPVAALTINKGGGYGQIAVTHSALVAPLPEGLDPAVAAAVPANTTTALLVLERIARLQSGDHVLVHAAAGGLGSQIGQIARLLGAGRVVGVVGSPGKRQSAAELGYDEVWLRSDIGDADPAQFDIIADPVAGPTRLASLRLLRLGGRLLAVGDAAQAGDQLVSTNTLWFTGTAVVGFNLGALAAHDPAIVGAHLRRALTLVARGDIAVPVSPPVPIDQGARVLAELRAGTTTGKAVFAHPHTA